VSLDDSDKSSAIAGCKGNMKDSCASPKPSGDPMVVEKMPGLVAFWKFGEPDGSYDAGWGSRAFKWTLWGNRTSDGIAALLPLAHFEPRIAEAVRRNVAFLRLCKHGLLHGGPHLQSHGRKRASTTPLPTPKRSLRLWMAVTSPRSTPRSIWNCQRP
jgi:hypothetical protein